MMFRRVTVGPGERHLRSLDRLSRRELRATLEELVKGSVENWPVAMRSTRRSCRSRSCSARPPMWCWDEHDARLGRGFIAVSDDAAPGVLREYLFDLTKDLEPYPLAAIAFLEFMQEQEKVAAQKASFDAAIHSHLEGDDGTSIGVRSIVMLLSFRHAVRTLEQAFWTAGGDAAARNVQGMILIADRLVAAGTLLKGDVRERGNPR